MTGLAELEARLRIRALAYPQAREDFPWGQSAFKVGKKVFCFLTATPDAIDMTVKLPASHEFACLMGAKPTRYGLGRTGWVTCNLREGDTTDEDLLLAWLDESYRAITMQRL